METNNQKITYYRYDAKITYGDDQMPVEYDFEKVEDLLFQIAWSLSSKEVIAISVRRKEV